jgi:hypothetical protein
MHPGTQSVLSKGMPTPASPGTNQFYCDSCGRYFNTAAELKEHQVDCAGAMNSGAEKPTVPETEPGTDREWKSVP